MFGIDRYDIDEKLIFLLIFASMQILLGQFVNKK